MTTAGRSTPLHRRRIRNLILGIVFFIIGVIGVLVPVMPQLIFFFLSAFFLSMVFPRFRRALRRLRQRYPKLDRAYKRWRDQARRKRRERTEKRRRSNEEHGAKTFRQRR